MSLVRVLFLCTGNSCRSQMAEGFAKALGEGVIEVRSAGLEAHGKNPRAIAAMAATFRNVRDDIKARVADQVQPLKTEVAG